MIVYPYIGYMDVVRAYFLVFIFCSAVLAAGLFLLSRINGQQDQLEDLKEKAAEIDQQRYEIQQLRQNNTQLLQHLRFQDSISSARIDSLQQDIKSHRNQLKYSLKSYIENRKEYAPNYTNADSAILKFFGLRSAD